MTRRTPLAVVGKGLIGSAAARYLAEAGLEVLLIGPDEPARRDEHGGVFASHYDAARITRTLDRDPLWAVLARDSLAAHGPLEAATGVRFHHPHAVLCVGGAGSALARDLRATAAALSLPFDESPDTHPELQLPEAIALCAQHAPGGWIAPRDLVQAQTLAALAAGAKVIRQPVWALREQPDGVRLILDDGSEVIAERVLLCAGAFTAPVGLVTGVPLAAEGRTVLLAHVEAALLPRLADLPCLLMDETGFDPSDIYLMPPIRYPDGEHWLKLGTGAWRHPLDDLDALQQWFRLPPPEADVERLTAALHHLLPVLRTAALRFESCAVTTTPSGRPIVDWTSPGRVAIACGGNGKAAKSSDALGRLGALLVSGSDGAAAAGTGLQAPEDPWCSEALLASLRLD